MAEAENRSRFIQPKHPVVLWLDDDKSVHSFAARLIRSLNINQYEFDSLEILTTPDFVEHLLEINAPIVISVFIHKVPSHEELRNIFDATAYTGVITDLEIGGNPMAGIAILLAASSSRIRPLTVLYSGRVDSVIEDLTTALGINSVIKKSPRGAVKVKEILSNLLDVGRQHQEIRALKILEQQVALLQNENIKLRNEGLKLKQDVEALNQRHPSSPATSKNASPTSEDVSQLKERLANLEREVQMVLAHHHDLTNTSSFTVQALDHLINEPKLLPPVIVEELERARISAKHCDVLVSSLTALTMKAGKSREAEPSSIERALRESLLIAERKIPPTVTVESKIPAKLPLCAIPEHLMVRCMLNLILNSLEAMPEGGRIQVTVSPPKGRSKYIEISVQDNGKGIRKLDVPKIFNSDFSTKGKPQGFGLFIVKKVLDDFGGKVSLSSVRGRGTKIALQIPIA